MNSPTRKKVWIDPRLIIGVVLIGASVAGVLGVISSVDSGVTVLVARDDLAPGDRIDASDLRESSVRFAEAGRYLAAVPDEGLIVTKPVREGELVPVSAVGASAGTKYASVVIVVNGQLPSAVLPGSTVDLWAARAGELNSFGAPAVIVSGATVVRTIEPEGLVTSGDRTTLELLVPRTRIARVLEAVANSDALSVVPTSLPIEE
jgi:hypothetical protein